MVPSPWGGMCSCESLVHLWPWAVLNGIISPQIAWTIMVMEFKLLQLRYTYLYCSILSILSILTYLIYPLTLSCLIYLFLSDFKWVYLSYVILYYLIYIFLFYFTLSYFCLYIYIYLIRLILFFESYLILSICFFCN